MSMLHSMNTITDVSITRTPDRLDCMNKENWSRELYLLVVDVVVGGGDADGDEADGDVSMSRSSMSGGGMFPLSIPWAWRRRVDADHSRKETVLPQGEEPDFGGPFTQVPRTCGLLFLLHVLDLRKWRRLPYLSMATSTSTSKVRLKSSHIPSLHTWMGLRDFLGILGIFYWAKPIYSNNTLQISNANLEFCLSPLRFDMLVFQQRLWSCTFA